MNHDEWREQAEIYALGALDGEELRRFEAHLTSGCRVCADRLRETREALTLLPRSLTTQDPPPAVRARLLQRIGSEAVIPQRREPQFGWRWWGLGAGALAAAGVLITVSWNLSATRKELGRLQTQMAALRTEVSQQNEIIRFLSDPGVRLVSLSGLTASPNATGRLLWNPTTHTGILLTSGLPPIPPDKAYELWAIAGREPVPAGVFKVDEQGRALFRLPSLIGEKTFDKFAVTLEPAGGVPRPTGPMHLLGSL